MGSFCDKLVIVEYQKIFSLSLRHFNIFSRSMAQGFASGHFYAHFWVHIFRVIWVLTLMGIILSLNLFLKPAISLQAHDWTFKTKINEQMKDLFR
jgi:hypothetical protein